jgi:hypothetical protein
MKVAKKIIFLLFLSGIVLKTIKTLYVQNNAEYISIEEVYDWYFKAGYYGNILISIVAIASFLFYRKYFPKYVSVCYLLMILLVTLASIPDFETILKKPNIIYSVKGIGTYINFGILFYAANITNFKKVLKIFYFVSFVFIISGIINISKIGFGATRTQYLDALRDFSVYLIWVFPYFLLQKVENKKNEILNILIFGIIFIFVLCTGARSYLVIYAVYLIVKFKEQLQSKNSFIFILGILVLLSSVFLLFANSGLAKALDGAVNNLSERATEDSRSEQIVEFLDQYNPDYLIQGVGPLGTWNWSHWNGPYYYLDNQFLLLAWWAGLPTLLVYLYFIVKPILQNAEISNFEKISNIKLILIFWLLACAGFAIYVGIGSDLYYDFITLLVGLQTCRFTLLQFNYEGED